MMPSQVLTDGTDQQLTNSRGVAYRYVLASYGSVLKRTHEYSSTLEYYVNSVLFVYVRTYVRTVPYSMYQRQN